MQILNSQHRTVKAILPGQARSRLPIRTLRGTFFASFPQKCVSSCVGAELTSFDHSEDINITEHPRSVLRRRWCRPLGFERSDVSRHHPSSIMCCPLGPVPDWHHVLFILITNDLESRLDMGSPISRPLRATKQGPQGITFRRRRICAGETRVMNSWDASPVLGQWSREGHFRGPSLGSILIPRLLIASNSPSPPPSTSC